MRPERNSPTGGIARVTPPWGATSLAGLILIAVRLAFDAAFALLAARFDYPDVLRRPTTDVLGALQAGTPFVLSWWAFALTAVALFPLALLHSRAIGEPIRRSW
jgi:hypothetical protein